MTKHKDMLALKITRYSHVQARDKFMVAINTLNILAKMNHSLAYIN